MLRKFETLKQFVQLREKLGRVPSEKEVSRRFSLKRNHIPYKWLVQLSKTIASPSEIVETDPRFMSSRQRSQLSDGRAIADLVIKLGRVPSREEMLRAGVKYTRDGIGPAIYNARKLFPEAFSGIVDQFSYDSEALAKDISRFSRFVVTTAVTGCQVDEKFLMSLENYCKKENALLVILPCTDPAASVPYMTVDSKLAGKHVAFSDVFLNRNLFLCSIKLSAKQIDPITGLTNISRKKGSFIFASPKMRLKVSAAGNAKHPHIAMSTGAITKPNYKTDVYMSERTAYIATSDHTLGAVVVEIEDDARFHFRQLLADKKDRSVVDLGVRYFSDGKVQVERPEAFILGDWHSGKTDPNARRVWRDICLLLRPKRLGLHDLLNGTSISPHERDMKLTRAKLADQGQLTLSLETKGVAADLLEMIDWKVEEIFVVRSNHDYWLDRYLEGAYYVNEPQNHRFSLQLASALLDGVNPLKAACEHWDTTGKLKKMVRWLEFDEDYSCGGVYLGAHGHLGSNGRKGSIKDFSNSYDESITAHEHTPEIYRGNWRVGTSSLFDLGYNRGPSSWMHTSCLLYANGARQLVSSIFGKWRSGKHTIDTIGGIDAQKSKNRRRRYRTKSA